MQAKDFNTLSARRRSTTRYSGRRVRVRGTIVDRDRKPEIVVSDPDNLKLVETKEDQQDKTAEAAPTPRSRSLDRLDAVLDRVEQLTERLDDAGRWTAAVERSMQASSQALMVAAATPPPPPPPPRRPGRPRSRARLGGAALGQARHERGRRAPPDRRARRTSMPGGNGWTTWLYDYGRSVSFDGRGRAQSLAGFPASLGPTRQPPRAPDQLGERGQHLAAGTLERVAADGGELRRIRIHLDQIAAALGGRRAGTAPPG